MVPIVGICRFSFLGRGDWSVWTDAEGKRSAPDNIADHAARLYDPARMAQRFYSFENLLLAAMTAQTDPEFHLVVLTSTAMPPQYQTQLRDLTASRPNLHLVISDAANVNDGLFPRLAAIRGDAPGLVQFRIDDDDCLSIDYVARLADFARRMQGFGPFSYSRPNGLLLTAYHGEQPQYFALKQAFHSMGTAVYLPNLQHTVFSFGHFALQSRFPSFLDGGGMSFLALKLSGHDSKPMRSDSQLPRGMTPISDAEFAKHLVRHFPYLDFAALLPWVQAQVQAAPAG